MRTIRSEYTDRMLIYGEAHLRAVLRTYAAHYNDHRRHQSRQQQPPGHVAPVVVPLDAPVTDRILVAGPRRLRAVLGEYVTHYNRHRRHRARNLRPPGHDDSTTAPVADLAIARIRRRKVLGGLIHEYEQAA